MSNPPRLSTFPQVAFGLLLLLGCSPTGSSEPPQPGGQGGATVASGGSGGQGGGAQAAQGGSGGIAPSGAGGTGGTSNGSVDAGTVDSAIIKADVGASSDMAASQTDVGSGASGPQSAGCVNGAGLPEGDNTIMVGNLTRQFRVRLPKNYTKDRAWPLVLALHPNGGAGIGFYDGDERPVRKLLEEKAVLIIPLARPNGSGWDWRGNSATVRYDIVPDLAYFEALITRAKTQLCVDESRIFSMGFSGGASFSGVLACMRKDIRAIAVAGSVIYFDETKCVNTPAAWVAIGRGELTADRTEFKDFWSKRAGCETPGKAVEPSPCVAYACGTTTPVHYCEHPAGHTWPGFATQAAIDFFAKF